MPITIKCSNCGKIFYHSGRVFSIQKVLKRIDKCPYCGKTIEKNIKKLRIAVK